MGSEKYKIGILAYGSLINNPEVEISKAAIQKRIPCDTPFKVEYARSSILLPIL